MIPDGGLLRKLGLDITTLVAAEVIRNGRPCDLPAVEYYGVRPYCRAPWYSRALAFRWGRLFVAICDDETGVVLLLCRRLRKHVYPLCPSAHHKPTALATILDTIRLTDSRYRALLPALTAHFPTLSPWPEGALLYATSLSCPCTYPTPNPKASLSFTPADRDKFHKLLYIERATLELLFSAARRGAAAGGLEGDEAEDVAAEALEVLLRNAAEVKNPAGYVYRTARRLALKRLSEPETEPLEPTLPVPSAPALGESTGAWADLRLLCERCPELAEIYRCLSAGRPVPGRLRTWLSRNRAWLRARLR